MCVQVDACVCVRLIKEEHYCSVYMQASKGYLAHGLDSARLEI